MKHLAALVPVAMLTITLAFAGRVYAQCADYATCAGQKAEAQAKLGEWARATASVVAEERHAAATEAAQIRAATAEARALERSATEEARMINAELATQAALRTMATPTPQPTGTATPVPAATNTPQPAAPMVLRVEVHPTVLVTVNGPESSVQDAPVVVPEPALEWSTQIIRVVAALCGAAMMLWAVAKIRKNA